MVEQGMSWGIRRWEEEEGRGTLTWNGVEQPLFLSSPLAPIQLNRTTHWDCIGEEISFPTAAEESIGFEFIYS